MIYGEGTGNIVLDDLDCNGTENGLHNCPSDVRNMSTHDCTHSEDAGVVCGGKKTKFIYKIHTHL